jgi:protein-tyrosine-phosphatase
LNKLGGDRLRGYSAGSQPKGQVNPNTIKLLNNLGYDTSEFRSKSWAEFAKPDAPKMDFVFTVCDDAAGETCPVWPGQPMTAHWGIPDPAAATGTHAQISQAFAEAYRMLYARISAFGSLRLSSLDRMTLGNKLKEIGRSEGATHTAQAQ